MKYPARLSKVLPSATFKYSAMAKKPGVINLTIGRPDFDTAPNIKEAAIKAIREGLVHYTPSKGIPKLRELIAEKLLKENGITDLDADKVLVSGGGKQVLYEAFTAFVDRGDIVALPNPGWVSYEAMVNLAEGKIKWLPLKPEDGFLPGEEYLSSLENSKAKLLLLNSPSNPTGGVIPEKTIKKIMDVCEEKKIFVISDEVYEYFVYDGKFYSPASEYDNVLTVNAFSKSFSMTGWRLGYAACKDQEVINKMGLIQGASLSCCTSFAQYGALAAFTHDARRYASEMAVEFEKRRDFVMERMENIDAVCVKPGGAFYVFPYFDGMDDVELAEVLLENGVGTIPGTPFGSMGKGCIRISFGSGNVSVLGEAFDRIEKALDSI